MAATRTRKPCPGCRGTDAYRQSDEVCRTCRYRLDHVLEAESDLWQMREKMIADKGPYFLKSVGLAAIGSHLRGLDSDEAQTLNESIFSLIRALVNPYRHKPAKFQESYASGPAITATEEGFESFDKFSKSLVDAIELSYIKGVEDGTNILKRMHSGDESASDYSDEERRLARKRRAIANGELY